MPKRKSKENGKKKHSKGWGPGNPLYDWKQKGGKPGKRKGKKGGKGKKKMPQNVQEYFKLRNQGMSKAAAKKKSGM